MYQNQRTIQSVRDSTEVRVQAASDTLRRDRGRLRRTVDSLASVVEDHEYELRRLRKAVAESQRWQVGPSIPGHEGRGGSTRR